MGPFHTCFLREMRECKKPCDLGPNKKGLASLGWPDTYNRFCVCVCVWGGGDRNRGTQADNGENCDLCVQGHLMWNQALLNSPEALFKYPNPFSPFASHEWSGSMIDLLSEKLDCTKQELWIFIFLKTDTWNIAKLHRKQCLHCQTIDGQERSIYTLSVLLLPQQHNFCLSVVLLRNTLCIVNCQYTSSVGLVLTHWDGDTISPNLK
jgi:hypothetical protein